MPVSTKEMPGKKPTTIYAIRKAHREHKRKGRIKWIEHVWRGDLVQTPSGLRKKDLMLNPRTKKVVSKRSHSRGRNFQARLKKEGRLAAPFTTTTAKSANGKSVRVRRARRAAAYASLHHTPPPYEDYYNATTFLK